MSVKEISIRTHSRSEMVDISSHVHEFVAGTITDGIVIVYSPHTTGGITINENADPTVKSDMTRFFGSLVPKESYFEHMEGNSDSHIKTTMTGLSVTIPVSGGRPMLGTWQGIYFCEFDGPRHRRFIIKTVAG